MVGKKRPERKKRLHRKKEIGTKSPTSFYPV